MKYLVVEPESLYLINRALARFGLNELTIDDFQEGDMKHLFTLVKQSLSQDEYEASDFVEMNLVDDFELPELLAIEKESLSDMQSKLFKDRTRSILRLRHNNVEDRLREIHYLQNDTEEKTYSQDEANVLYLDLIETRKKIDQALMSPDSGGTGKVRNIPGVYHLGGRSHGSN